MKCFNHPEREAVATCQKCGKGLCRECAEKHTPCLCNACAVQIQRDQQQQAQNEEERRKEKYKDALVDTRSEFIKAVLVGILVGVLCVWFMKSEREGLSFTDLYGLFYFGILCSIWLGILYISAIVLSRFHFGNMVVLDYIRSS